LTITTRNRGNVIGRGLVGSLKGDSGGGVDLQAALPEDGTCLEYPQQRLRLAGAVE
jgi:hypothetical protein